MSNAQVIELLKSANWYDLNMACSIFAPPQPGEQALKVHFFKRVTGAYGGGLGANGQLIEWSNSVGTHLVGERAFHSGAKAIADITMEELCGEAVICDLSAELTDYSLYTPDMVTSKVDVKKGDILIINTGYHRHQWDQPDNTDENAQGGIINKEFAYWVRHPGPSPDFYQWALDMELKLIGVDCGLAEHPMNTNIRYMHGRDFDKANAKMQADYGKSWDELFPPDDYYKMTHITMPKAGLRLVESLGGQIDALSNQRVWLMVGPIPFMEVESAWSRVMAIAPPDDMEADAFFDQMRGIEMLDMTLPFSVQTPQWANYEPLTVTYTKRVGGQYFGMGRNNAHCKASFHLATHMDGEIHFHAAGRTIGQMPFDYWRGDGVIADISHLVSDTSVYTPAMIESVVDVQKGDILLVKTGWYQYGWNSPDSDEFRYMIRHPGPSPDFADWCIEKEIKWLGVDCVAMEHPMNTIQRNWHPKTFDEANRKLIEQYGADWDEVYPLDTYYQDMHLNLFPKGIVHVENIGGAIADADSGRYFIAAFVQKGMELASCWLRMIAFRK